jgi:hypothetical protein
MASLGGDEIIWLFPPGLTSGSASGISFRRMLLALTGMASGGPDFPDFDGWSVYLFPWNPIVGDKRVADFPACPRPRVFPQGL